MSVIVKGDSHSDSDLDVDADAGPAWGQLVPTAEELAQEAEAEEWAGALADVLFSGDKQEE